MNLEETLRLSLLSERTLIVRDPRYHFTIPHKIEEEEIWEEI